VNANVYQSFVLTDNINSLILAEMTKPFKSAQFLPESMQPIEIPKKKCNFNCNFNKLNLLIGRGIGIVLLFVFGIVLSFFASNIQSNIHLVSALLCIIISIYLSFYTDFRTQYNNLFIPTRKSTLFCNGIRIPRQRLGLSSRSGFGDFNYRNDSLGPIRNGGDFDPILPPSFSLQPNETVLLDQSVASSIASVASVAASAASAASSASSALSVIPDLVNVQEVDTDEAFEFDDCTNIIDMIIYMLEHTQSKMLIIQLTSVIRLLAYSPIGSKDLVQRGIQMKLVELISHPEKRISNAGCGAMFQIAKTFPINMDDMDTAVASVATTSASVATSSKLDENAIWAYMEERYSYHIKNKEQVLRFLILCGYTIRHETLIQFPVLIQFYKQMQAYYATAKTKELSNLSDSMPVDVLGLIASCFFDQ
jgi:hypothetical protein